MAEDYFARGMAVRTEVLGEEYVQRSMAGAREFTAPMQRLTTEFCWGAVWDRPGLDRRTRSLLNLGMLTALNHHAELGAHTEGALRNGCTVEEIQETLLQAAIYCGIPAGLAAFRTALAASARAAATGTPADGTAADGGDGAAGAR